jgi:Tfp pilus assembly protein PilO
MAETTEKLKRIPFFLIFVIYAFYMAYDLYNFHMAPDGAVEQHKVQIASSQEDLQNLKKKLVEGQKFLKSVEAKKAEIGAQVKKLSEYQGALSEVPDVPSMIKLLITEAKKIDLKVDKIEPGKRNQTAYYLEQEFKIDVHGSYVQMVLFAERVSQLQRILRIEAYDLKPSLQQSRMGITLDASLSVRAYQYTPSPEDRMNAGGKT